MKLNEAIEFLGQLNIRINELGSLRSQVSTRESRYYGDQSQKVIEPQYDVTKLDEKITRLQNWRFKINAQIKSINAKTELELEVPVDELLSPIVK